MEGTRRILVADDDEVVRDLLQRVFSDEGYEVRMAEDGREALAYLRTWEPHVVLVDLEMPRMSGLDLLRHIRAQHEDTPAIAFSGHPAAEQIAEDARRLGAAEFIAKPLDLERLGELIEALCTVSSSS